MTTTKPPHDGNADENASKVDIKNYHTFIVQSTKHLFSAPTEKYSAIASVLGLDDVDNDATKAAGGVRLARGSGYIYLSVQTAGGANFKVVCDPAKVGTALKALAGKKIYNAEIKRAYIPKRAVFV